MKRTAYAVIGSEHPGNPWGPFSTLEDAQAFKRYISATFPKLRYYIRKRRVAWHEETDARIEGECYHCGPVVAVSGPDAYKAHKSWCPDFGTRPDAGRVGEWAYSDAGLGLGAQFRRDRGEVCPEHPEEHSNTCPTCSEWRLA